MITLEEAKLQCRIEPDITYEDDLLNRYIAAAYVQVEIDLDRKIYQHAVPSDDKWGVQENKAISQAVLLLVAHWYANREATTDLPMNNLPLGYDRIIEKQQRMGM